MLSKCCVCCISLRTGCFIMAMLAIITGVMQATILAKTEKLDWENTTTSEYLLIISGFTMPGGICNLATITAYQQFVDNRILAICVCSLYLLTFTLLLFGAFLKNTRIVCISQICFGLLVVFGFVSLIVVEKTSKAGGLIGTRICFGFGLLCNLYYWICITSYLKRLKDKKGEVLF